MAQGFADCDSDGVLGAAEFTQCVLDFRAFKEGETDDDETIGNPEFSCDLYSA